MLNWTKLVGEGRAKAVGVPWSDQELVARTLGIPADYVRSGILTLADYDKAKAKKQVPVFHEATTVLETVAKVEESTEVVPEAPKAKAKK